MFLSSICTWIEHQEEGLAPAVALKFKASACLVYAAIRSLSVAIRVELQSVVRNVAAPNVALLIVATLSAKVQNAVIQNAVIRNAVTRTAVTRTAVIHDAVLNVAVPIGALLSLVQNAVTRSVVPNVVFQSAALQIAFHVIRVVPIVARLSVQFSAQDAARNVVALPAPRVDVPHEDSRAAAPWLS